MAVIRPHNPKGLGQLRGGLDVAVTLNVDSTTTVRSLPLRASRYRTVITRGSASCRGTIRRRREQALRIQWLRLLLVAQG